MTTMQGASVIEGRITARNDRGVKLAGHDGWVNVSKYADEPIDIPQVGTVVKLGLDKSGFIRSLRVGGGMDQDDAPRRGGGQQPARDALFPEDAPGVDRDRRILRQAVLNTAVAILSSGARKADPADVIDLAAELEEWVLR